MFVKDKMHQINGSHGQIGVTRLEEDDIHQVIEMKGEVFGKLHDQYGNLIEERSLGTNHIMFEARLLLAELMKFNFNQGDVPVNGITHLALGVGGPFTLHEKTHPFDLQNPPIPGVDIWNENRPGSFDVDGDGLSELVREICRKEVKATYVDEFGGPTLRRTPTVDFTATFGMNEANDALVEMALFGGKGASESNNGTMVTVKTFPVWNKINNTAMTITYRISF